MCIAIYKPTGASFPSLQTLQTCYSNNPDGAGYMYAHGGAVQIRKGFADFSSFYDSLQATRARVGDLPAFVLHFRISTQAGTRRDCTHPFPLSSDMNELRKLKTSAPFGVAHNGIIWLTSSRSPSVTYSDTMAFITDYLHLIIDRKNDLFDPRKCELIERLAESRLAILHASGACKLLGSGWSEDGGCWYSNASYKPRAAAPLLDFLDDYEEDYCEDSEELRYYFASFKNGDFYDFDPFDCPATLCGDCSYCTRCTSYADCYSYGEEVTE